MGAKYFSIFCRPLTNLRFITVKCHRQTIIRSLSSLNEVSHIVYRNHGNPINVLEMVHQPRAPLDKGHVQVQMLASPINPADINMIQGSYPIQPPLPAVGGNEGVGEVVAVGEDVTGLEAGDWVLPSFSGWGTWKTEATCPTANFIKIDNDIPIVSAATLSVNPCTAYRMLTDFEDLKDGDVVIQNGANSGVGQAVIQIAKERGIKTVNIIRDRNNVDILKSLLKELGATYVLTEESLKKPEIKQLMSSLPKPRVAFNCVGGRSAVELLKYLDRKGCMITYGAMSRQPLVIPAAPLLFKDIRIYGYWMTRWNRENSDSQKRMEMLKYLCNLIRADKLQAPISRLVHISNYKDAISKAMESFVTEKQILVMDQSILDKQ